MTFDESVGIVFPRLFIVNRTHLVTIEKLTRFWVSVRVDFAEVMEHTNDEGAFGSLPFEIILCGQTYQAIHDSKGMVEQTALITTMIFCACRGTEKTICQQIGVKVLRNDFIETCAQVGN